MRVGGLEGLRASGICPLHPLPRSPLQASVKISNFGACIRYHNLSEMNRAHVRSWSHKLDSDIRFFWGLYCSLQQPKPDSGNLCFPRQRMEKSHSGWPQTGRFLEVLAGSQSIVTEITD